MVCHQAANRPETRRIVDPVGREIQAVRALTAAMERDMEKEKAIQAVRALTAAMERDTDMAAIKRNKSQR